MACLPDANLYHINHLKITDKIQMFVSCQKAFFRWGAEGKLIVALSLCFERPFFLVWIGIADDRYFVLCLFAAVCQ